MKKLPTSCEVMLNCPAVLDEIESLYSTLEDVCQAKKDAKVQGFNYKLMDIAMYTEGKEKDGFLCTETIKAKTLGALFKYEMKRYIDDADATADKHTGHGEIFGTALNIQKPAAMSDDEFKACFNKFCNWLSASESFSRFKVGVEQGAMKKWLK